MATHNTHRAAGRAVTPLTPSLALKGAGGAAVIGSVMVGSFATAQAAPAAPAAPQAAVAAPQVSIPQVAAPQAAAPATVQAAVLPAGKTIARGHRGSTVETLQAALNHNGADIAVDGKFGPATHAAVVDFQQENGLKVDGRVGPETRGALNESTPASVGKGTTRSADNDDDSNESSSKSSRGGSITSIARSQIGADYRWGAKSPGKAFDCSGFTSYVYEKAGITLPHSSSAQARGGKSISKSQAQPGDLVVWPGHIGIYAGGNKVIDAGRSPDAVTERNIWGSPSFVTYR